jgi:LCP family protein required for cell wall assembly
MSQVEQNQPKSRWPRRIKFFIFIVFTWLLILALVFNFRLNKIEVELSNPPAVKPVGQTWLLMGTDSRAEKKDPLLKGVPLGKFEGARADTIIFLSVAKSLSGISLTSLPRDLLVEIPAYGERTARKNKINAAYAFGGPQLSVNTVENFSQIQVEHYLEIGFVGLVRLVDAVGGIEVCATQDFADEKAGLYINAGCQVIDGKTALAYSRARFTDPRGDLGRVERQQEVIKALVKKTSSISTLLNPVAQFRIAWELGDSITVDQKTNAWDIFLMSLAAIREINSGTLPVESGGQIENVGAVLVPVEPATSEIFAEIKNGELVNYLN